MKIFKQIVKKICRKIVDIGIQYQNEEIYAKFGFPYSVKFYNVSFEGNISIGKFTYINERSRIDSGQKSKIIIGDHCAIGRNVHITSKTHSLRQPTTDYLHNSIPHIEKDINIGNYVWIGDNVIILPGVSIDDYAVIGANSVVNRDIISFETVGGNPIKHIRLNIEHYKYQKQL